MWLLVTREPRPDAPYWPGRRWLAAVDAVAWPGLCVTAAWHAPEPVGLVLPFATASAVLFAIGRLRRAIWENRRYRFSTWRWAGFVGALLVLGAMLKVLGASQ